MSRDGCRMTTFVGLVTSALIGCSTPRPGSPPDAGSGDQAASAAPSARPPAMGTFEIDGKSQPFRIMNCDPSGSRPDGILVRGSGTLPDGRMLTPDGRRLGIEVERLQPNLAAGMTAERATVQYGSFMDKDGWERAGTTLGNRWTTDRGEVADGLIITVTGRDVVVEGTFRHLSGAGAKPGTLRVTCPAPAAN